MFEAFKHSVVKDDLSLAPFLSMFQGGREGTSVMLHSVLDLIIKTFIHNSSLTDRQRLIIIDLDEINILMKDVIGKSFLYQLICLPRRKATVYTIFMIVSETHLLDLSYFFDTSHHFLVEVE